jgi:hypothetical protein
MFDLEHKMKYEAGNISFVVDVKNEAGEIVGYNHTSISAVMAIKAIIEASPTKVDDILLPYLETLSKLIPSKEV